VPNVTHSPPAQAISRGLLKPVYRTTKLAPADQQFGLWQEMNADVIALELADKAARGGFPAERFTWALGDLQITQAFLKGAPERIWRHRPRSWQDHWCVVLARAPRRLGVPAGRGSATTLAVRLLSMPYEGRGCDEEVLSIFLPRDSLDIDPAVLDRTHCAQLAPAMANLLTDYLAGLNRVLPTLSEAQAVPLAEATRALIAACITPSADSAALAERPARAALQERARRVVRENMGAAEFGPEDLCRLLAVSRSKLYRLFEPAGGVARFIQRERLHEAHRRLTDPMRLASIHVVGLDVGFLDHSTFSRAFRREFGYSPSDAREKAMADGSAAAMADEPGEEWTIAATA
jgi:AraC-like DNA-binding protein